jgi:hypothetical protein
MVDHLIGGVGVHYRRRDTPGKARNLTQSGAITLCLPCGAP